MSFSAYPDYKHSGIELLAEYPSHWVLKRFKNVFQERAERSTDGSEELLSVSAYFGVKPRSETLDEGDHLSRAESLEGYKVCSAGDLVINIMLAWNRGLGFSWQHGIVSPAYSVFRVTDGSLPKFLDYLVRSDECIRYFKTHSAGIMDSRLRLYPESFGRLFSAIPPAGEQAQIARFLDHETARIDALIEEQQRLIELLKEKRQAVISHAVTKGLDPTAPRKDSGVEWLGEVPQHWQVGALGYFAGIDTGATPDRGNPEYWGGDIPWIKTGEVNYENISQAEEHITREGVKNSAAKVAPKGTLLMAMYGQGVTRGRVAILDIEAAYNQACAGIFVDGRIRVEYLRLFFIAAYPYIRDGGNETSQMNLSSGLIAKIKITVPSISEQISVEHFLNAEMARFNSLINEAGLLANHLQERRSALISAAVTGKIDVRGWQPPVITQAPELEVAEAV